MGYPTMVKQKLTAHNKDGSKILELKDNRLTLFVRGYNPQEETAFWSEKPFGTFYNDEIAEEYFLKKKKDFKLR